MKRNEIDYALKRYARKGGKVSRRRQAARVEQFLAFCSSHGVREPNQIGKRHVYLWFEEGAFAATTIRDKFYAVALLWELLGRGEPPRPHGAESGFCTSSTRIADQT